MRSSCVAFCLFAIYLSSSSHASSIARRDGHLAFPGASLENVQEGSNYPTEGAGDPKPQQEVPDVKLPDSGGPNKAGPKPITDAQANLPPPVTGQEDKKEAPSNYPTGSSGPENPVEQASSPPPVTDPEDKNETPSNYPSGGSGPDQPAPTAPPPPPHETAKDPTKGQGPPVTPSPALGDMDKPKPSAPGSPPAVNDNSPTTPAPPPADNSTSPPADNSPASPAAPPTSPAGNSTSPSTDSPAGSAPPGNGQDTGNKTSPSPSSTLQCFSYLDANTDHAACGPEGTPNICTGGCSGAIVAQLCQLNETSPPTTETCTNAYRENSATVHVCINDVGAFSCKGPATGSVSCNGCPPKQDANTPGSENPSQGSGSPNSTTPGAPGGDSGNSAGAFISPFNALLTSAITLVGGALLL